MEKHMHNNENMQGHQHENHHSAAMMYKDMLKKFFIVLILIIPLAILSPMFQDLFNYSVDFKYAPIIEFVLASIIFFYGGSMFLKHAKMELENKKPGMMVLISLAIVSSYLYSLINTFTNTGVNYYFETASLILIMLLGHALEAKTQVNAKKDLSSLAKLLPNTANKILANGEIKEVKTSSLKQGEKILVRPGERVSLDGRVVSGNSTIDESMISGESVPVEKQNGDEVVAGSINGDGSLEVEILNEEDESYLKQVIKLTTEAQMQKSQAQSVADKAAALLFYVALAVGLIALVIWTSQVDFNTALAYMVSVFVIACPHALGLAIPLVNAKSSSLAAKSGLVIQNRVQFEQAHKIDMVAFDKTGTLSESNFTVDNIISLDKNYSKEEILNLVYSLEYQSEHPIAKGIVKYAEDKDAKRLEVKDYKNLTGAGLEAEIKGKTYYILNPQAASKKNFDFSVEQVKAETNQGRTVFFLASEKEIKALISVSDKIKDEAKKVIKALRDMGIKTALISGDNKLVAENVAKNLGIDRVYSEVLPDEKADIIKGLEERYEFVAMVGDGVNDAPALANANIGIAIGAGTDVAIESADLVLVEDNLKNIINVINLSKETYKKTVSNLIWAAAYNIIAIPLAAGILAPIGITLSPQISAILMSLSTIITAINAASLSYEKI